MVARGVVGLILCGLAATAEAGSLFAAYVGFDHVVVYDPTTREAMGYDVRMDRTSSPLCDTLHYPPVAPPTPLNDHVTVKTDGTGLRLTHLNGESFLLQTELGAFTAYSCHDFGPFLSALPCAISSVGEAPDLVGNFYLFRADGQRVLVYDSADGSIRIHAVDTDIAGRVISNIPVGINEKPMQGNLGVSGERSMVVLEEPKVLVVLEPTTGSLSIHSANYLVGTWPNPDNAVPLFSLLQSSMSFEGATNVVGLGGSMFMVYDSNTGNHALYRVDTAGDVVVSSTVQTFAAIGGGHACLHDSRSECLRNDGCGWCITSQACLHMAEGQACDNPNGETGCADWCSVDDDRCSVADTQYRRVNNITTYGKPSDYFDPNIVSPADVNKGAIKGGEPMFAPIVDLKHLAAGTSFEPPRKTEDKVGLMNEGYAIPEDPTGCSDNEDKRSANEGVLAARDSMNDYRARVKQVKAPDVMPEQAGLSVDYVVVDDELQLRDPDLSPLKATERPHLAVSQFPVVTAEIPMALVPDASEKKEGPLTVKRMRRLLMAEPKFKPVTGSTKGFGNMMNGKKFEVKSSGAGIATSEVDDDSPIVDAVAGEGSEGFAPTTPEAVRNIDVNISGYFRLNSTASSKFRPAFAPRIARALAALMDVSVANVEVSMGMASDANLDVHTTKHSATLDGILEAQMSGSHTLSESHGDAHREHMDAHEQQHADMISEDMKPHEDAHLGAHAGIRNWTSSSGDMELHTQAHANLHKHDLEGHHDEASAQHVAEHDDAHEEHTLLHSSDVAGHLDALQAMRNTGDGVQLSFKIKGRAPTYAAFRLLLIKRLGDGSFSELLGQLPVGAMKFAVYDDAAASVERVDEVSSKSMEAGSVEDNLPAELLAPTVDIPASYKAEKYSTVFPADSIESKEVGLPEIAASLPLTVPPVLSPISSLKGTKHALTLGQAVEEDAGCNDDPDDNFMNGAAAKQGRNWDNDGEVAQGKYTSTVTHKMLRAIEGMSDDQLSALLMRSGVAASASLLANRAEAAAALSRGSSAPLVESFPNAIDDLDSGFDMKGEIMSATADTDTVRGVDAMAIATEKTAGLPVIDVEKHEANTVPDFSEFATAAASLSPTPSVSPSPAVNSAAKRELVDKLRSGANMAPEKTGAPHDADGDPMLNPEALIPGAPTGTNIAISDNGAINPISLDKATTAAGVPSDADPLGGTQTRGPTKERAYPEAFVNVRSDGVHADFFPVDLEGGLGPRTQDSAVALLEVAQDDGSTLVFDAVEEPASGVTLEVDPLSEFRDAADDASDDDDLEKGCVSSEDGYTGNSQPRIDYLGNDQVIHIQPMMGVWTVYNVSSRRASTSGVLPVPFKPVRRAFLGGKDNRFVEHYPLTGVFKFYKCPQVLYETCTVYASGQWDKTVDTDDVLVPLEENRVLAYNQDTGAWRVFNFDRDVVGAADPFSTATPPVARGQFPDFADEEVLYLGNGQLLVHSPPTGRVRVFAYEQPSLAAAASHRRVVIKGPTHVTQLPDAGHRLTAAGTGKLLELFTRRQTMRLYACSALAAGEPACTATDSLYLYQSVAFQRTPVLTQMLSLDRVASLPTWSSDSSTLSYVRRGSIVSVTAAESARRDLRPGEEIPITELPAGLPYVYEVFARPGKPAEFAALVQGDAGDIKQIVLVRNGNEVVFVDSEAVMADHTLGGFSADGNLLSFVTTDAAFKLQAVRVDDVWTGEGKAVLAQTFDKVVVPGPFSADNRYVMATVGGVLQRVDIVAGVAAAIELDGVRVDRGASFHPFLYQMFAIAGNTFGVVDIMSGGVTTLMTFENKIAALSFDSMFTRCAVTLEVAGYAEYQMFAMDKKLMTFKKIPAPFLSTFQSLVGSSAEATMLLSPSGEAVVVSKETFDDPAQLYIGGFGSRPVIPKMDASALQPKAGVAAMLRNMTERSAPIEQPVEPPPQTYTIMSALDRLTLGRVAIPDAITSLPAMATIELPMSGGAYHFPANVKPLLKSTPPAPLPPPIHRNATKTTILPKATPVPAPPLSTNSFDMLIPYVIYIPEQTRDPSMWTSTMRASLSYLRSKGVGVIVPFSTGGPVGHSDVANARNFICSSVEFADCKNIALVGEAGGAYLALLAEANSPAGTFAAVVDVHGVTDIATYLETLRPQANRQAQKALFGASASPVAVAKTITAPVMLVHGQGDTVVAPAQSEKMVSAVRANGRVVKYMALHGVRHSLTHGLSAENKLLAASSVAEFLLGQLKITK